MSRSGQVVNLVCQKKTEDDNGKLVVCGSTDHTLSGSNTWVTIKKSNNGNPPVKVLKQRYVCKECGQFNYTHLDGSPLKEDYSDSEVKKLVRLTKIKQQEKITKF